MKNQTENIRTQESNAVVTDAQLEAGEFPIGRVIHVSTVTHAFRGVLETVTPSHYLLKRGTVEIIHSTGDLALYSKARDADASEAERVHCQVRIPRGSIAWELTF